MNKSKKRVCILTSVHPLYDTRIFHKQAKTLHKSGYEVFYIVQHEHDEIIDGIQVLSVNKPKSRFERIFKTTFEVFQRAKKVNADIYHFHDPELIIAGLILAMSGKKVIYDVHENVSEQIRDKDWLPFNKLFSKIYKLLEKLICKKFALILAEQSYAKLYPKGWKKTVVQNFPDLKLFPQQDEVISTENSLVYLGGVTKLRGICVTLEALKLLKDSGCIVNFKCIGPIGESLYKELETMIKQFGLENSVKFYGRLNALEAYKIVAESRIGLAILKPVPNYLESYPTKVFEYMALSVPFITSNFPLYEELVKETKAGVTINPENPSELALTIKKLLNNSNALEEMGRNGRKAVEEKYNWEKESEKLLTLYRELIG